ncbi:hypothetical protein ACQP2C_03125 [Micromonospora zamorensis]|uniref:hypothetical protein n=1 Tax=Micromonospora zamorensis TaxID=709883 RepID=UPI003D96BB05
MTDSCAFCGSTGPLTREHVFGQWVSKVGLDLSPVRHMAGPLNGLPRDMGEQPPYRQTVKDFCSSCNNGWMSRLEDTARRVLSPIILGKPGAISAQDQPVIAMWAQKTALTAMLLSSKEQRSRGHGLSQSVYTTFYECQSRMEPLGASRFWVGQYEGTVGFSAVHVTPLAVRIPGIAEPDRPQCYAMTIVLGKLALQGLFFTTPALEIDVTMGLGMPQIWPPKGPVGWPIGQPCTEEMFRRFANGEMLRSAVESVELRPWSPATELPQSVIVDGKVHVPALCGKHSYRYPAVILAEALRGRFHAFATGCACPQAYLIQTEADGAHCKAVGAAEGISDMYEDLPGTEVVIHDEAGVFFCKRLPAADMATITNRQPIRPE